MYLACLGLFLISPAKQVQALVRTCGPVALYVCTQLFLRARRLSRRPTFDPPASGIRNSSVPAELMTEVCGPGLADNVVPWWKASGASAA